MIAWPRRHATIAARPPQDQAHVTIARVLMATCAAMTLGACTSRSELRLTAVGRFDFVGGANDQPALVGEELSGLVRSHDDEYFAVSDQHATLHRLRIHVDPRSGQVNGAEFEAPLVLRDANGEPLEESKIVADREGVIFDAAHDAVVISHEESQGGPVPALSEHSLADGHMLREWSPANDPALAVFASARDNRGFESLARRDDGTEIWTANEEALTVDGDLPTDSTGTVVRLQKLDRHFQAVAQYAYVTDPLSGTITFPSQLAGLEASGVSDLLVLPDGTLLVLERMFAGDAKGLAQNRIRIYVADFRGASDVSKGALAKGLLDHDYQAVKKRRLVDLVFPLSNSNFEGIALGPQLANGDYSVLLIADNQEGTNQALFALRLSGMRRP